MTVDINSQNDSVSSETIFIDCVIRSFEIETASFPISENTTERFEQLTLNENITGKNVPIIRIDYSNAIQSCRKWSTIEVDKDRHANVGHRLLKSNHSFRPNCRISIDYDSMYIDLVSIGPIDAGSSLSWNYCMSEWIMDEQFCDWQTGRECRGFASLSKKEQDRMIIEEEVCPHIYERYCSLLDSPNKSIEGS